MLQLVLDSIFLLRLKMDAVGSEYKWKIGDNELFFDDC